MKNSRRSAVRVIRNRNTNNYMFRMKYIAVILLQAQKTLKKRYIKKATQGVASRGAYNGKSIKKSIEKSKLKI